MGASSFKLAVHVHGASAPELRESGIWRSRPRLEVLLGPCRKETELADFVGDASSSSVSSAARCGAGKGEEVECPWRFGDTLVFAARLADALATGLRFRLGARRDVLLGFWEVEHAFHDLELGEAVLDLRQQVLAECLPSPCLGGAGAPGRGAGWETGLLTVPLRRVCDAAQVVVVAHVVLSCSVNVDPELLLQEADQSNMSLLEKVVGPVVRCAEAPVDSCCSESEGEGGESAEEGGGAAFEPEAEAPPAAAARWRHGPPCCHVEAIDPYATCEVPGWLQQEMLPGGKVVRDTQRCRPRTAGLLGIRRDRYEIKGILASPKQLRRQPPPPYGGSNIDGRAPSWGAAPAPLF